MARMFPAKFPHPHSQDSGIVGERMVYEALSEMPAGWTVIYNSWRHLLAPKAGSNNEEHVSYEADFIVLIPNKGIVVLEVKNWQRGKVENGRWLRGRTDGTGFDEIKYGSPLNQACRASKNLQVELKKYFRWGYGANSNMEFRCAAILLGRVEEFTGMEEVEADAQAVNQMCRTHKFRKVPRNEVYDRLYLCGAEALNNLQHRLNQLFCFENRTTAEELDDVRRYLLQNMVFKVDAATANRIIDHAAAPLQAILPMLEESPSGVHVKGCAGSGKSSMLCAEAVRQARSGAQKRVLILCFNRNLTEYLRSKPMLQAASVRKFGSAAALELDNFQDVADCLCRRAGVPGTTASGAFQPGVIEALCHWLEKTPQYKVDSVFVDEAQDFYEDWWKVVKALLKPEGKLYLFSDAGQQLYNRSADMPPLPVRLRLTRNLRNTAAISSFASAVFSDADHQVEHLALSGPAVEVKPGSNDPEARALMVREAIAQLQEEGFALHDIVALTPWRRANSLKCELLADWVDFLPDGDDRRGAAQRLKQCCTPGAERVLGETVKAFKGLESPAVILTDVITPQEGKAVSFSTADFYVACTRARYRLIIIPVVEAEAYLRRLQNQAKA